eukprot:3261814-Heterocapsa_arctica.AAC.1
MGWHSSKELFEEAKEISAWIIKNDILKCMGVLAIHPCNSVGDDIKVYTDDTREKMIYKFYGLFYKFDELAHASGASDASAILVSRTKTLWETIIVVGQAMPSLLFMRRT